MANTAWNPSDKSAGITLSGGNLIATNTNNNICGVRAVDRQITGKFYWEVTYNTVTYNGDAAGVINAAFALATIPITAPLGSPVIGLQQNGAMTGGVTGPSFGAIAAGSVVCFALDAASGLFWARVGAAGNWNASATANPATGAGAVSILSLGLGGGIPIYPWCEVSNTNDVMTANFGDSAFSGAVPSGFTSGFPAGVTTSTNALVTQAALEAWGSANPQAQATLVALEQWISVASIGVQAVVTQVALEEWGSVATFGIAAGAGEADAAATVTGVGVAFTPPGVGTGEVDAGATVTGTGATIHVAVGTGEADAGADVEGAGFVGAIGAGEADAFADVRGMGAVIAPPNALPFLPGLGWSVHRRPTFDTIVATHPSGSEVRLALWQNCLWEFELSYDALASNDAYPGVWTNTLQTLMGFYLARGGQRGTFLFIDPDFNTDGRPRDRRGRRDDRRLPVRARVRRPGRASRLGDGSQRDLPRRRARDLRLDRQRQRRSPSTPRQRAAW